MYCEHQVYPERSLGIVSLRGMVTGSTIVELCINLYMDGSWRPGFDALWDGREITELALLPEDVDKILVLAQVLVDSVGSGKMAVVSRRELHQDLAMLFAIKSKGMPCSMQSFKTLNSAWDWLGVKHPPLE
jgi:hypothetical protein